MTTRIPDSMLESPSGVVAGLAYVEIIEDRALLSTDLNKVLRNTGSTNRTLTVSSGFPAGAVFATSIEGSGKLSVVAGSGLTGGVNDPTGLVGTQVQNGPPVGWQFVSTTKLNAL